MKEAIVILLLLAGLTWGFGELTNWGPAVSGESHVEKIHEAR
jgi:hypothetical protein